jgi:hypothetical protein
MEPQASLSNLQGARAELKDQAAQTAQSRETRGFGRSVIVPYNQRRLK